MRTKRIFSMFLTLILTVSIVFPGIKLTSYAQSGSDLKMENDWVIQDNDGDDNIDTPVFYSIGEVEIYRLYNPNNGDHLLTLSDNEKKKLIEAGWIDEKIGMWTPKEGAKNA